MKTITTKIQIAVALTALAFNLNAQTTSQNKTHIKMDIIENGKETKIDTSFSIPGMDDLQTALKQINVDSIIGQLSSIEKVGHGINIELDTAVNGDARQKSIIINEQDDNGKKQYVKITSGGTGENAVVVSGDGDEGKDNVAVSGSKDGNYTVVVNEEKDSAEGKSTKTVKVIVFKTVEVNSLSDDDKRELPKDVAKTVDKAKPFSDLVLAPNPTDGNLRITYTSTSTDMLTVKVLDMRGRCLLAYAYDDMNGNADKTISLSNLSKGMYFVQLTQGHHSEVRKVVVN